MSSSAVSGAPRVVPKGSTILVVFPFTDFIGESLRPALVLCEGYLDVTVAFITSQIPAKLLQTDLLIPYGTPSSTKAGLKMDSVLLIDKIATIEKEKIKGILGEADKDLKQAVNVKIAECLMFNVSTA